MHRGYIKLWRKTLDSFIFHNPLALKLFVHLLMTANYKDTELMINAKKHILKRGQLITGRQSLAVNTNISESMIFRLLNVMESEQLIEQQKTNRYSIITIVSYNMYQSNEQLLEHPVNNRKTPSRDGQESADFEKLNFCTTDEQQNSDDNVICLEQQMNNQRTSSEHPVNTSKELLNIKKNNSIYGLSVQAVFDHLCLRGNKKYKLTPERESIIQERFKQGYTAEQMMKAIDNCAADSWEDRIKFFDVVYIIGTRNKINNLDKWLNIAIKQENEIRRY